MLKLQKCQTRRIALPVNASRRVTTASQTIRPKPTGDISSVFPSLSGGASQPLPPRFVDLKRRLIRGHEEQVTHSWYRLLADLREEARIIAAVGSSIVPELAFRDLDNVDKQTAFRKDLHKRGVAIVRGVVSEQEALGWKELAKRYIHTNPSTKGFPAEKPAVFELYWSPSQILARAHPNLLKTQTFLMSHWHCSNKSAQISTLQTATYADRLRIRQPGDSGFALGPHVDGGSCERWEENGYGRGSVYNEIFKGNWEAYDPWESSCRLPVASDLYNGPGGCSMFRMFQGWLSMSATGPGEGTLKVNPLLSKATAYFLLRPFFQPIKNFSVIGPEFLDVSNWQLEDQVTSTLQGAVPAMAQEINGALHPHLELESTMVHIPHVRPGDYVVWHCDTIHAVDKIHAGNADSSVMYIPACPLTEANAEYLKRQRETFLHGTPAPDFPSGLGESEHMGRLSPDFVMQNISIDALRAMGLAAYDLDRCREAAPAERQMLQLANQILDLA